MNLSNELKMTVYASLMSALIAAGAFIAIPLGPVPIVLQNFFVLLAGLVLGSRWGLAGVAVYLLAGALGLPVFAGGTGGIGRIIGPTGGYLLGYIPAVYVTGLVSEIGGGRKMFDLAALIAGCLIVYLCGVPWLKMITGMSYGKAFAVGLYPFIIGDALKILAALSLTGLIRPMVKTDGEKHHAP
jgi:biotin transport system substrate-specific component